MKVILYVLHIFWLSCSPSGHRDTQTGQGGCLCVLISEGFMYLAPQRPYLPVNVLGRAFLHSTPLTRMEEMIEETVRWMGIQRRVLLT